MTPTAHTQRAHARLAPSAAHRWMECPGSVRMEADLPEQSSVYAAEGTAAHELCAHCLSNDIDAAAFLGSVIDIEGANPGEMFGNKNPDGVTRFEVTDEMVDAVQTYLDAVRSLFGKAKDRKNPDIIVDVEQRLDMTHLHPEIFGTGDAVVYQKNTAWLHVLDFKYGKGVAVDPTENPQLMLYGAGAAQRYNNLPIKGITLHIVQPRTPGDPVRSWPTDLLTLMEFEQEIATAAGFCDVAAGDDNMDADTWAKMYLSAGEHCRFCKAAPTCPAYRQRATAIAVAEFADDGTIVLPEPSTLAPEQMADVLRDADLIGNWVKAVQEYAHKEAVAGRMPPGFKLVAKRANRRWKDDDEAKSALEMLGVDPFADPKLKSPAQVEKAVGKKQFGLFTEMVTQVSSGTNLVPVSDARPAVKAEGLLEFTTDVES